MSTSSADATRLADGDHLRALASERGANRFVAMATPHHQVRAGDVGCHHESVSGQILIGVERPSRERLDEVKRALEAAGRDHLKALD